MINKRKMAIYWTITLVLFVFLRMLLSELVSLAFIFSLAIVVACMHYYIFPYFMKTPISLPTSTHVLLPGIDGKLRLLSFLLAILFAGIALFMGE